MKIRKINLYEKLKKYIYENEYFNEKYLNFIILGKKYNVAPLTIKRYVKDILENIKTQGVKND